jgi:hypothetical protein
LAPSQCRPAVADPIFDLSDVPNIALPMRACRLTCLWAIVHAGCEPFSLAILSPHGAAKIRSVWYSLLPDRRWRRAQPARRGEERHAHLSRFVHNLKGELSGRANFLIFFARNPLKSLDLEK